MKVNHIVCNVPSRRLPIPCISISLIKIINGIVTRDWSAKDTMQDRQGASWSHVTYANGDVSHSSHVKRLESGVSIYGSGIV